MNSYHLKTFLLEVFDNFELDIHSIYIYTYIYIHIYIYIYKYICIYYVEI